MPHFSSNRLKLSDLIDSPIQTGFQIRDRFHSPYHPSHREKCKKTDFYNLIQIKSTSQSLFYQIQDQKFDKLFVPTKKRKFMEKYLLKKQDLLYLSKLRPGAFRYTGSVEGVLPSSHFYILRLKLGIVDPDYLCWVLNQDFMKAQIQTHLKGTTLPFITKEALKSWTIPLPSMARQKQMAQLLHLRIKEKEIQNRLNQKKNIFINTFLKEMLPRHAHPHRHARLERASIKTKGDTK